MFSAPLTILYTTISQYPRVSATTAYCGQPPKTWSASAMIHTWLLHALHLEIIDPKTIKTTHGSYANCLEKWQEGKILPATREGSVGSLDYSSNFSMSMKYFRSKVKDSFLKKISKKKKCLLGWLSACYMKTWIWIPGQICWKEKTESCKLSFDHTCIHWNKCFVFFFSLNLSSVLFPKIQKIFLPLGSHLTLDQHEFLIDVVRHACSHNNSEAETRGL